MSPKIMSLCLTICLSAIESVMLRFFNGHAVHPCCTWLLWSDLDGSYVKPTSAMSDAMAKFLDINCFSYLISNLIFFIIFRLQKRREKCKESLTDDDQKIYLNIPKSHSDDQKIFFSAKSNLQIMLKRYLFKYCDIYLEI